MLTRYPSRLALMALVVAMCAACSGSTSPTEPDAIATAPTDFSGQYLGTYLVTSCSADPVFGSFCGGFPAGTTPPITLSLTQSLKDVTGTISLGALTGTFTGTASGGVLTAIAVMQDLMQPVAPLRHVTRNRGELQRDARQGDSRPIGG